MTIHRQPSPSQREELVDELRVALREAITTLEGAAAVASHEELRAFFAQGATHQRSAYRRLGRVTGRTSRIPEAPTRSGSGFAQLDEAAIAERVARSQARLAMTFAKVSEHDELPASLRAVCLRGANECRRQVEQLVSSAVDLRHGVAGDEDSYYAIIAKLEKAASVPPVVGEAEAWAGGLCGELDRVCQRYAVQCRRHTKIRSEMAERDPELSHRRETLVRLEGVVAQQLRGLVTQAEKLSRGGDHDVGQDEPFEEARRLRIRILAWCVAARALEGDIQSSYLESHYRDRGTVD